MTREEAVRRYQIPLAVLREYEAWGMQQCKTQYDNRDLERLSLITALEDLGFSSAEAKEYLLLWEREGTESQQLEILEAKRKAALNEIHRREEQLCRLDCLRHSLRKKQRETK